MHSITGGVEHFPSILEALVLIPNTTKKGKSTLQITQNKNKPNKMFSYFDQLNSPEASEFP